MIYVEDNYVKYNLVFKYWLSFYHCITSAYAVDNAYKSVSFLMKLIPFLVNKLYCFEGWFFWIHLTTNRVIAAINFTFFATLS